MSRSLGNRDRVGLSRETQPLPSRGTLDLGSAKLLHAVHAVFDHEVYQEEGVRLLSLSADGGLLSRKGGLEGGGRLHGDH